MTVPTLFDDLPAAPDHRGRWHLTRPDGMKASLWVVLQRLAWGPACGTDFMDLHTARYSARLHELRELGCRIDKQPCSRHHHPHQTRATEYRLASVPKAWLA